MESWGAPKSHFKIVFPIISSLFKSQKLKTSLILSRGHLLDTLRLLEENIGKTFSDINCSNVFLGQSPKAIGIKVKINKWDLIIFLSFCTAKETINKTKRQPMDWEKIFANDATDKGFSFKIGRAHV